MLKRCEEPSSLMNVNNNKDNDQDQYDKLKEKLNCVICFSNERTHLIIPCFHLCCCSTCIIQIEKQCPICRRQITAIQRIFLV